MTYQMLRFVNNVLATVILVLAAFVICSPFLPEIQLALAAHLPFLTTPDTHTYQVALAKKPGTHTPPPQDTKDIPKTNTIIIPEIGVHGEIYEGESIDTMNLGIWRRPHTSTPDHGGNTVLVAHRYLYTSGPNTFYHLPKLARGDRMVVFWNKKEYIYEVTRTQVVDPDAMWVEQDSATPMLTLYTCTPLWTSQQRFVVQAKPV